MKLRRIRNRRQSFARNRHTLGQYRLWLTCWNDTPEARYWPLAKIRSASIARIFKKLYEPVFDNVMADCDLMRAFAEAHPAGVEEDDAMSGGRYIESAHYFDVSASVPPAPSRSGRTVHRVLR